MLATVKSSSCGENVSFFAQETDPFWRIIYQKSNMEGRGGEAFQVRFWVHNLHSINISQHLSQKRIVVLETEV